MITLLSFSCESYGVLTIFGGKKWREKKMPIEGQMKPNIIEKMTAKPKNKHT